MAMPIPPSPELGGVHNVILFYVDRLGFGVIAFALLAGLWVGAHEIGSFTGPILVELAAASKQAAAQSAENGAMLERLDATMKAASGERREQNREILAVSRSTLDEARAGHAAVERLIGLAGGGAGFPVMRPRAR